MMQNCCFCDIFSLRESVKIVYFYNDEKYNFVNGTFAYFLVFFISNIRVLCNIPGGINSVVYFTVNNLYSIFRVHHSLAITQGFINTSCTCAINTIVQHCSLNNFTFFWIS